MSSASEIDLLGKAMIHGITPNMRDALSILEDKMFSCIEHRQLFNAIKLLDKNDCQVNLMALMDFFEKDINSPDVALIAQNSSSRIDPIKSARQISRSYNIRESIIQLNGISQTLQDGFAVDLKTISDQLMKVSGSLDIGNADKGAVSFHDLAVGFADVLEDRYEGKEESKGLDIGLDVIVDRTDLVVIGGTPGMGKTALAMYCSGELAKQGKRVVFYSLEMEAGQLFEREVSRLSGMPVRSLKDPLNAQDFDIDKVVKASGVASQYPIYVDDSSNLTIPTLSSRIRKFTDEHPETSMIVIDYLTLIEMPKGETRALSVGEASRRLKLLAKELKIPILLLSQMNRDAAKAKREPEISDLRDSGQLEQDASIIIFPYREEVYFPDSPNKGMAKILKRKTRNEETGDYMLAFRNGNFVKADVMWKEREEDKATTKFEFGR